MRKKILYIVTKSVWGGAQRYVFDLATRLPREEFDIAVACGGEGPLRERLRAAGVRILPIPWLRRELGVRRELLSLGSILATLLRERPDIIHLNSSKAGGLGAVAAFAYKLLTLNGRPVTVFTVHGWPFREDRPAWQRAAIFFFSWLSTLFQDRIIVIDTADYRAGRRFVPARKLALVPHGLPPTEFLPRPNARAFLAERMGIAIAPDTVLVGTIAELTANKGLTYLIEAASQISRKTPHARFQTLIIGEGEERERLQRHIRAHNLEGFVFLPGFIPDAQRYLKGLDLFVLPSLKEGLPYALMEAMAAGVPVVASAVGGVTDLVADGSTGLLIPPKDPQAIASAMARISSDPNLRWRIGAAGRQKIRSDHGLAPMLTQTRMIYSSQP